MFAPESATSQPPPLVSSMSSSSASSSDSLESPPSDAPILQSPTRRMHLDLPPNEFSSDHLPTPKVRTPKRVRIFESAVVAGTERENDLRSEDDYWHSFSRLKITSPTTHNHNHDGPARSSITSRPPSAPRRSSGHVATGKVEVPMPPVRTPAIGSLVEPPSRRKSLSTSSAPNYSDASVPSSSSTATRATKPPSPAFLVPEDLAALDSTSPQSQSPTPPRSTAVPMSASYSHPGSSFQFQAPRAVPAQRPTSMSGATPSQNELDRASLLSLFSGSSNRPSSSHAQMQSSSPFLVAPSPTRSRFDDMADRSSTDWRALSGLSRLRDSGALGQPSTSSSSPIAVPSSPAKEPLGVPEPPRVLTPPPVPAANGKRRTQFKHAHDRFLCQSAPPPEASIEVHSHPAKYRIELNMPLIDRDAVTISTRRAQTLHIAGDGWERGGGHFERKVRFGWDADLTRVSAEFEGDKLIVGVPRKPSGLQGQVGTPMPMGASV